MRNRPLNGNVTYCKPRPSGKIPRRSRFHLIPAPSGPLWHESAWWDHLRGEDLSSPVT